MQIIRLKLEKTEDLSYSLLIGEGIFESAFKEFLEEQRPNRVAVILDDHLAKHYQHSFEKDWGVPLKTLVFQSGEANKRMETILSLADELFRFGLDRKSLLVAFGGGVCGDMTGFLASIFMRGIPFLQVPTSLLAMVDSSVGGKTGVDLPQGKNLIGTFHQPKQVILDSVFLKTLPWKEWINGFAEMIKHGLIFDASYFERFESTEAEKIASDSVLLSDLIQRSCEIKGFVVERDEKEGGFRQILNFGHTLGHAIESAANYTIPHGFSIALGMLAEAWIGKERGIFPSSDLDRMIELLDRYTLLDYRKQLKDFDPDLIVSHTESDKKNRSGEIRSVLLQKIGSVFSREHRFSFVIEPREIRDAFGFLKTV